MQSKEYYINILRGVFVQQIDIPNDYLADNDIMQCIYNFKWAITQQNIVSGWSTLTKNITVYD